MSFQRYSCSLRQQCEPDEDGIYSREECEANCSYLDPDNEVAQASREYVRQDPSRALLLAPSDRVSYLEWKYGIIVSSEDSYLTLLAVLNDDWLYLYDNGFYEYLEANLTPLALYILTVLSDGEMHPPLRLDRITMDVDTFLHQLFSQDIQFPRMEVDDSSEATAREMKRIILDNTYRIAENNGFYSNASRERGRITIDLYWPYILSQYRFHIDEPPVIDGRRVHFA